MHKQHTCNLLNLNYSDKHIALFIETFCPMLGTVLNILHTDSHLFFFFFFSTALRARDETVLVMKLKLREAKTLIRLSQMVCDRTGS